MLEKEILNVIENTKKGTYVRIEHKSVKTPLKEHKGDLIEKYSITIGRLGCDYQNLKDTQQKITEGVIEPNGQLKWGHWREGYVNLIIDHKEKSYLRVSTSQVHHTTSKWYLNGVETTKQWLIENKYISESKATSNITSVFNIEFSNIIKIGA